MPYADPEQQRAAKRESARRRRAEAACGTTVEPEAPTFAELAVAGRILDRRQVPQETPEEYHAALRQLWQGFLRVVEG